MGIIPIFIQIFCVFNAFQLTPAAVDKADLESLRLVQVLYRHGDRAPIEDSEYPTDPVGNASFWPEGFGALTKRGKQQHYELGKYLRRRYDGYLSKAYSPSEISVLSSSVDRCIMSAECNLAGLFPPTVEDPKSIWNEEIKWQPIPFHTLDDAEDNLIRLSAACPRLRELKAENMEKSEFVRSIDENEENRKLYAFLSEKSGSNVTTFKTILGMYDTLLCQSLHNLTLPEWTAEVFPSKMAPLAELSFDSRVLLPTRESKRVYGGPLLKSLVRNMNTRMSWEETVDLHPVPKMFMYSGHDTTLAVLLGTLGVFDTQLPPYASMVMLETHELRAENSTAGEEGSPSTDYFLKVFFRNSTQVPPYELAIPDCGSPCELDKLVKLFEDVMVDDEDWDKACESRNSTSP